MLMILNTYPHIWDACIHTERAEKTSFKATIDFND